MAHNVQIDNDANSRQRDPRQGNQEDNEASEMMDQKIFLAAVKGDVRQFTELLHEISTEKGLWPVDKIVKQVSPSGKTLLHVAAGCGNVEITKFLASQFPFLITWKNSKGNTALHAATRAGKLSTSAVLVEGAKDFAGTSIGDDHQLLRIKNEKGNTALHVAVMSFDHHPFKKGKAAALSEVAMNDRNAVAKYLISADSEVSYYENNEGKSPLYLAVETGDKKILELLLDAMVMDVDSQERLQGKSPVHATIEREDYGMLEDIIKKKPELIHVRDDMGWNPLHCAAFAGYLKGVQLLLDKYSLGALERDNEGLYPLHVACQKGRLRIVQELLEEWLDPTELLSYNGQNILHVAAKGGRQNVVRYLLKNPKLDELVNEMDNNGNTPLHLAAMYSHPLVVGTLAWDRRTKWELLNNEGLTPYEIAEEKSEITDSKTAGKKSSNEKDKPVDGKSLSTDDPEKQSTIAASKKYEQIDLCEKDNERLQATGTEKKQSITVRKKKSREPDFSETMMTLGILYVLHIFHVLNARESLIKSLRIHNRPPNKEYVKERINSLLVVAVLVAGAAFAAAIQTPGGGELDDWGKKLLFKMFVIFDVAALNTSLLAAIVLCWAHLVDVNFAAFIVWAASGLVGFALYMTCLGFLAAVAIAVIENTTFTIIVVVLEVVLILAQTIVSIPLVIPFKFKELFIRGLYFFVFCAYFALRRCLGACFRRNKEV